MLLERLADIDQMVSEAADAVSNERNCCPALDAVVKEFQRKSERVLSIAEDSPPEELRDAVIELDEAGGCAKAAAEAEVGLGREALRAVLDAQKAVTVLKSEFTFSSTIHY